MKSLMVSRVLLTQIIILNHLVGNGKNGQEYNLIVIILSKPMENYTSKMLNKITEFDKESLKTKKY